MEATDRPDPVVEAIHRFHRAGRSVGDASLQNEAGEWVGIVSGMNVEGGMTRMGWIRLKAQLIDRTTGEAQLFLDRSFDLAGLEYLEHSADGATVVLHLKSGSRFRVVGPDVERLVAALGIPAPPPGP